MTAAHRDTNTDEPTGPRLGGITVGPAAFLKDADPEKSWDELAEEYAAWKEQRGGDDE